MTHSTDLAAAAFEKDTFPHLDALYRIGLRMLLDTDQAAGAVQETYRRAWQSHQARAAGPINYRLWLCEILFTVVPHERRSWFSRIAGRPRGNEPTLEDSSWDHLPDGAILAAVDALPLHLRAPVVLIDAEEFTLEETARILRLPTGAVLTRLDSARSLLRQYLRSTDADSAGASQRKPVALVQLVRG